jgi:peptidoglycan DL-endopeptidase CwlO
VGAHPARARTLRVLVIAALAAVGVGLATTAASAAPSPGQIEAQIDQKWNTLEPLIEKYNTVHDQLTAQQAKVNSLKQKIAPLALQVDLAMSRVSVISVERYKQGPGSAFNAMLTTGSPTAFVDQLTILDQLAKGQTALVSDAQKVKAQYDAQKAPIDTMVAQLAQQQQTLAAQRSAIQKQIDELNRLRMAAYGSGTGIGSLRPAPCPSIYDGSPGARAAKVACAQAGKSYVFGSDGPGTFDCSGLTQYAWQHGAGLSLPHNARAQKGDMKSLFTDRASLHIGDLVFYYNDVHHVAIYVGGGWVMAASNPTVPLGMRPIASSPINSFGRPE